MTREKSRGFVSDGNDSTTFRKEFQMNSTISSQPTVVLKVEDLAKVLSIGMNSAYELVRSGAVRSVKVGRVYRIPKSAVYEYLNQGR